MTESKWTKQLEKKYGDKLQDKKKSTLSEFFKIKVKLLDEVYDRGRAAGLNTGMRKGVTSVDAWGRARMNKFIIRVMEARKNGTVNNGRGEDGDLVAEALGTNEYKFI